MSEDGHPVEGDYSFTVGETPTLYNEGIEATSEEVENSSKESGSNLLVNGAAALILIATIIVIVRRLKK